MIKTPVPIRDGDCSLIENFLRPGEASDLQTELLQHAVWHQPQIILFGKQVSSPRTAAWYGDPGAEYRYSGLDNVPLPWLDCLAQVRDCIGAHLGQRFNSVLLNRYRDGDDAMGWHADDEPELGRNPVIASLSLGATRRFLLRHIDKREPSIPLLLSHGSLLVMSGATQHHWKHSVPRTRQTVGERINLTFRQVIPTRGQI